MHVTTKETDEQGKHILTSIIEGDGATALASDQAELSAEIISVKRTPSGGIQVQAAVSITEPSPEQPAKPQGPDDQAVAYLATKGFDGAAALLQVKKFGSTRILAQRDQEQAATDKSLDEELKALLTKPGKDEPPAPASPAVN